MKKTACIIFVVLFLIGCSTVSEPLTDTPDYSGYLPSITWSNIRGLTPEVYGIQNSAASSNLLEEAGRKAATAYHEDSLLQESVADIFPKEGVCDNKSITEYSVLLGDLLKSNGYFGASDLVPVGAIHYINDIWCVQYSSDVHTVVALSVYFHAIDGHIVKIEQHSL